MDATRPKSVARGLTPEEVFSSVEPPLALGSCLLKIPEIAGLVQEALTHFEGDRYFLSNWCIMPNHVHIVVSPLGQHRLSAIIHSWKSYTSHQINKKLGRKGSVWEAESFDHLIRSAQALEHLMNYTESNPVAAGLCRCPADWPFSSAGTGFKPSPSIQIVNPRETPFSPIRDRGELPHLHKESGTYFITFRLADAVVYKR
jgi:REP element-mobilizing transposase RayT